MVGTWSTRYLHCVSAIVRERDRRAPRKVQYVKPAINVETSFLAAVARVIPADWTRSIPRFWENMMWRGTPVDLSWFAGLLLERIRHLMILYSWPDRHLLQESRLLVEISCEQRSFSWSYPPENSSVGSKDVTTKRFSQLCNASDAYAHTQHVSSGTSVNVWSLHNYMDDISNKEALLI